MLPTARHRGDFLRLLGDGNEFGVEHLNFTVQQKEAGIADALKLAEDFVAGDRMVVILGDNIITTDLKPYIKSYQKQSSGARILLKEVPDPRHFGIAEIEENTIKRLVEKPVAPKSNRAVMGIYFYDTQVFDFIRKLKPSSRGELEITDVNKYYLRQHELEFDEYPGDWFETGTFYGLLRANVFLSKPEDRKHLLKEIQHPLK